MTGNKKSSFEAEEKEGEAGENEKKTRRRLKTNEEKTATSSNVAEKFSGFSALLFLTSNISELESEKSKDGENKPTLIDTVLFFHHSSSLFTSHLERHKKSGS